VSAGEAALPAEGLSREMVCDLAKAAGAKYQTLVLILRFSGLTWPWAVGLTRRRCDPLGRWLELVEVADEAPSGVVIKPQKPGYGAMCALEPPVSPALADHLAAMRGDRYALVFTDDKGQPLRRAWFDARVWRPALRALGLPATIDLETLALDRLRESWATNAAIKNRCRSDRPTEVPALTGWREWDAACSVLLAPAVAAKVAGFVDVASQEIDVAGLLDAAGAWSHGERLLVELACNLWNGAETPSVRELVATLDDANFVRALRAIGIARGWEPDLAQAGQTR
jgi:hypothetical protein